MSCFNRNDSVKSKNRILGICNKVFVWVQATKIAESNRKLSLYHQISIPRCIQQRFRFTILWIVGEKNAQTISTASTNAIRANAMRCYWTHMWASYATKSQENWQPNHSPMMEQKVTIDQICLGRIRIWNWRKRKATYRITLNPCWWRTRMCSDSNYIPTFPMKSQAALWSKPII